MDKNQLSKIANQVKTTGYPLELEIADILSNRDYYVAQSLYFVDEDENKPREIDLRALYNYKIPVNDSHHFLRNVFLIECKKSRDIWVFPSSKTNHYDPDKPVMLPETKIDLASIALDYKLSRPRYPLNDFAFRARNYFQFQDNNSSQITDITIIKALTSAVKATLSSMKSRFAAGENSLCYYYPIVVFDGTMCEALLHNGEIDVREIDKVLVSFNYESTAYKQAIFSVPIVTKAILVSFLADIEKYLADNGKIYEALLKDTYPDWKIGW